MAVTFLNKKFKNPLVLVSGIYGLTPRAMSKAFAAGFAGVTTKSTSLEPRAGYPHPNLVKYEHGFLNCIGLKNNGVEETIKDIKAVKAKGIVIASIVAKNIKDFGEVAKRISQGEPDFIEANISCPNVEDEFGKPFATSPEKAAQVTEIVKKNTEIPLIIKLSPNVIDIKEIAKAVEQAGADALAAINSLGPGMLIDLKTKKPVLSNKFGGVTGPAIKPIALRCVYEIAQTVKIPIIGMGGIVTGKDALEMMTAGATLVGIGSAIYLKGLKVVQEILKEIKNYR